MKKQARVLVTGSGGFIGGHMVKYLVEKGHWVRGVDIVRSEFWDPPADEFLLLDLRRRENCLTATRGIDHVYHFAANMGGVGYLETARAEVMHDNVLLSTHMLEASRQQKVQRFFYTSSACIYPTYRQEVPDVPGLKEDDAYPADCDNEYGWEKLYSERLCAAYLIDHGFHTRVARLHNIYGPCGTWEGGREKAPAAMCRKAALVEDGGRFEIWGDGRQTRSFCFIDDCLEGIDRLMWSNVTQPLNVGSDEMVTIDELADLALGLAGKRVDKSYDTSKPQGVRGRSSDNTLIRRLLAWSPSISLAEGMKRTYPWIEQQVRQRYRQPIQNSARRRSQERIESGETSLRRK